MYFRLKEGLLNSIFLDEINKFIQTAKNFLGCLNGDKIRYPCNRFKCQNHSFQDENAVKYHLIKYVFVHNYLNWYLNRETEAHQSSHTH